MRGAQLTPIVRALRERRRALGWSQFSLGEKSGYDEYQIHRWEKGLHQPSVLVVANLAETMGMQIELSEKGLNVE